MKSDPCKPISHEKFKKFALSNPRVKLEYDKLENKFAAIAKKLKKDKGLCCSQTGFQGLAQIDSSSLSFPLGAPAASKRSLFDINEHCEQGRNNAENQNAKSIWLK